MAVGGRDVTGKTAGDAITASTYSGASNALSISLTGVIIAGRDTTSTNTHCNSLSMSVSSTAGLSAGAGSSSSQSVSVTTRCRTCVVECTGPAATSDDDVSDLVGRASGGPWAAAFSVQRDTAGDAVVWSTPRGTLHDGDGSVAPTSGDI